MSQFRYVGGDIKPILLPTDPLHPIEEGDLVFRHPANGCAWPAADMANQGTKALNQDAFQQYFAGVAMNKVGLQSGEKSFRLMTDPGYVSVATEGDFSYPCPSNQYAAGDLVGVFADTNGCASQEVDTAASPSLAIGQAKPGVAGVKSAVTEITVAIRSTLMNPIEAQVAGSGSGQ